MTKTLGGIIIAVIVIVGGIYFFTRTPITTDTNQVNTTQDQNQNVSTEGRVVFSVTDAAANMSTISEINMKVSKVDVHSASGSWATVSTTPRTYSLLALNTSGQSELLAEINTKAGTYDQVRLTVDSIAVITKAGATKEAKLPSGELKINTNLVVTSDSTSSVNFDFLADKSLHVTGNGSYIFAPVVKTETRSNAGVSVDSSSVVTIVGGRVDDASTIGMDIDGTIKLNFQIDSKQKLNIGTDNVIKIGL